ncbi:hypothetical protein K4F52_004601 [Lecanicillium sp. MT-2017a]|nr:hypothetical protein K4F52_004601 [Lecanicillium sp. MT-2017a]
MDFVKKAASALGNKDEKKQDQGGDQQKQDGGSGDQGQGQSQQKDDYVDKAFAFGASKTGQNINRDTQEKITDGGRSAYEKMTGSKVSDKVSN